MGLVCFSGLFFFLIMIDVLLSGRCWGLGSGWWFFPQGLGALATDGYL